MGGNGTKGNGTTAPKKAPKRVQKELDSDDEKHLNKQREAAKAQKEMAAKLAAGGKIGAGMKKSGKK